VNFFFDWNVFSSWKKILKLNSSKMWKKSKLIMTISKIQSYRTNQQFSRSKTTLNHRVSGQWIKNFSRTIRSQIVVYQNDGQTMICKSARRRCNQRFCCDLFGLHLQLGSGQPLPSIWDGWGEEGMKKRGYIGKFWQYNFLFDPDRQENNT
jgi:hypothetical protein